MNGVAPVRLEPDIANGKRLDPMKPWPEDVRISGAEPAFFKTWFEGQISAQVAAVPDGTLRFADVPFDEVVVVLNGTVTVTPDGESSRVFNKGDVFVIPQGFRGTYEVRDGFRELTVMETKVLRGIMKSWNLTSA